jgi:hypothetical protein
VKTSLTLGGLLLGGTAIFLGQFQATAVPGDGDGGTASVGPDVIVGAIPDVARYAPGTYQGVEYASYALGSTSCNIGTAQLLWQPNPDPDHPTIPQNLYRIKNGVIEQIGLSWCKHGFCALQQTLCGACQPAGGGCPTVLGIGCSDPYTASLNGAQGDLKSRGPINPATGVFSGTYTDPSAPAGLPASLRERVMVARADLDPAQNAGATYVAECQYIHPQDAASGNDTNNASYRMVSVGATWSTTQGYPLTLSGPTVQQLPAIFAWQASAPSNVGVKSYDVIGDGRFLLGYRVIDNGNGTWRYEYAIQNLNSDRAGGSFSVPIADGVNVTNIGFKSPAYFNGENYSNAPWTTSLADGALTWTCEPNTNANANALRWSTLYNFRFTADIAPQTNLGLVTLGLWKAPTATSTATSVQMGAPIPATPAPPAIAGDYDGNGVVDGADLANLLNGWGAAGADLNNDGTTDGSDLAILLNNWG